MKKNLLMSYIAGIFDTKNGERYDKIIRLFLPEFVIAFLIYFLPLWLDAYFIAKHGSCYYLWYGGDDQ